MMGIDWWNLPWRSVARAAFGGAAIVAALVVAAGPNGGDGQGARADSPAPVDRCSDVGRLLDRAGAGLDSGALDAAARERLRGDTAQGRDWVDSGCGPDGYPGPLLATLLFGVSEDGATARPTTACALVARRLATVEAALASEPQGSGDNFALQIVKGRAWAAAGCDPAQDPGNLARTLAVWVPALPATPAADAAVVLIALP